MAQKQTGNWLLLAAVALVAAGVAVGVTLWLVQPPRAAGSGAGGPGGGPGGGPV
ncbi:MAG: hypothetical protein ACLFVN_10290 [Phycisphaeraceae bacterium]